MQFFWETYKYIFASLTQVETEEGLFLGFVFILIIIKYPSLIIFLKVRFILGLKKLPLDNSSFPLNIFPFPFWILEISSEIVSKIISRLSKSFILNKSLIGIFNISLLFIKYSTVFPL